MKRAMTLFLGLLIVATLAFAAWVRLAPSDPGQWHVPITAQPGPADQVVPLEGAATLLLSTARGTPAEVLAKLDATALATPRTTRLAGSVDEGRITWITRSALWGFPDYTTAEIRPEGVLVHARLRFGKSDLGVNAARLSDWLSRL